MSRCSVKSNSYSNSHWSTRIWNAIRNRMENGSGIQEFRNFRILQKSAFTCNRKLWTGRDGTGAERRGRDGTGRDRTGRDGRGRDGTARDGTGRHGTGRDGTGQDGTGRDRTGQFEFKNARGECFAPIRAQMNQRSENGVLSSDVGSTIFFEMKDLELKIRLAGSTST